MTRRDREMPHYQEFVDAVNYAMAALVANLKRQACGVDVYQCRPDQVWQLKIVIPDFECPTGHVPENAETINIGTTACGEGATVVIVIKQAAGDADVNYRS